MSRVQHVARCVHRLQQKVRARSTVTVGQDAAAGTEATPSFELAKPFRDIPGPKPLPIIGNSWRFLPVVGKYHNLTFDELQRSLHAEYGPVCLLRGMPSPDAIYLADPNDVQKVYRSEGVWPKRSAVPILDHFYSDILKKSLVSLLSSQDKEWHDFRSAVNQVMMQPRNVQQYLEPINNVSQEFIERMRLIRTADGRMPADFIHEIAKWALESISYVALDTRLGLLGKDLDPASDAVVLTNIIWGLFDNLYDLDIKPSPWKWVSTPAYRKFIGTMNRFNEITSRYVDEAVTRLKSMSCQDLEKGNRSVLESVLLKSEDPRNAVSLAMDMIIGGVDATSATTSAILYQLATHPEKQAKLHEELDLVIPDKNKAITKGQIQELRYMRACIKEGMRIMPVLPGVFRDAGKDLVLGGYQVPKGTVTGFSSPVILSSDKYFPKADQFIPERWLHGASADVKSTHPFAFLPFSFGSRNCVGKRFAEMELETVVAKVFRNFKVGWDQPPVKSELKISRKFNVPLQFTVHDRQ